MINNVYNALLIQCVFGFFNFVYFICMYLYFLILSIPFPINFGNKQIQAKRFFQFGIGIFYPMVTKQSKLLNKISENVTIKHISVFFNVKVNTSPVPVTKKKKLLTRPYRWQRTFFCFFMEAHQTLVSLVTP